MSNVKTVTLAAGAVTTVRFDASFPYYWIDNQTNGTIYAAIGAEPVPETDGTFTVAAGGKVRLSGGITPSEIKLKGSGKVQVVASGIAECPFKVAPVSGGGKELTGNSSYTIENTVDYPLIGLNLYGKSTQNGTPTPENPVDIVSVGDSGTVNITANNGADVSVTAEITTALPLCGIPVSSGGNYTDSNGQQWVCDELIYNADGTGKIVKYVGVYTFTGNENFALRNNDNGRCVYAIANLLQYKYYSGTRTVSDKYVCIDTVNNASEAISRLKIGEMCFYYDSNFPNPPNTAMYFGSSCTTLSDFKSEIAGSTIIYALTTPLEIQLTAAEMTALRQLQTFNGTTSISNSSGAEMNVKYCTNKALSEFAYPITMGLQKQIDELRAAILSMGGNV